ncbi:MAG: ABC transporter permease [Thermomicrobiales bacterium]
MPDHAVLVSGGLARIPRHRHTARSAGRTTTWAHRPGDWIHGRCPDRAAGGGGCHCGVRIVRPWFLLVFLVLLSTGWVAYQRVVRLQARALGQTQFVEASRSIGGSRLWIIRRHVLPNLAGTVAVLATQQMAAVILFEAALSYLGLGMPVDAITWGRMVADGRETMLTAWWVPVVPGCFIALAVLGFHLIGEWFGTRQAAPLLVIDERNELWVNIGYEQSTIGT